MVKDNFQCAHDELIEIHKLQPNPKNPNKHPVKQIEMLAKIIDYQGQRAPIVVSKRSGFITKGHGRLMAIEKLGWTKAAVDFQDYDDEAQEFADMVADNKIAELAEHDDEMFKLEALNLELDVNGFDLDLLGIPDLDLSTPDEAKDAIEDEVPEVTESISKLGDLYELGEHRLLCGDSTNKEAVERLMNGISPLIMITDPPYGIEYDATWREDAGVATKTRTSKVSNDNRADWTDVWMICRAQIAYVFHASKFTDVVKKSLEESDFEIKQQIIWNKPHFTLGRQSYHWKHEPCWYAVKNGKTTNWLGSRDQSTVWDAASPIAKASKSFVESDDKVETIHPTQKPIKIYEIPIKNHTTKSDVIYDPFGGSGTLVIASEKNNRKSLTMELDPHYVDVIVTRWCKYTGKTKVKRNGTEIDWVIG